jgi:hypothetical protein
MRLGSKTRPEPLLLVLRLESVGIGTASGLNHKLGPAPQAQFAGLPYAVRLLSKLIRALRIVLAMSIHEPIPPRRVGRNCHLGWGADGG